MGGGVVDDLRFEVGGAKCFGLEFHVSVQIVDGDFVLVGHQPDFGAYLNDHLIALPKVIVATLDEDKIRRLEVVRTCF